VLITEDRDFGELIYARGRWILAVQLLPALAEVRHGTIRKPPNPFRISSGDR
jgi:hypothetical protein